MGGFINVVRPMAMAALAFGLAFGLPNMARAQAPTFQDGRLSWQKNPVFTSAAPFDNGWTRVLSDTKLLLRSFAHLNRYGGLPSVTLAELSDVDGLLWNPDIHSYMPPSPERPTVDAGAVRATLKPVTVTPTIVAESQTIQSVLLGVHFEVFDTE